MTETTTYPVPAGFSDAHITPERYQTLYQQSLKDPDSFWSEQAELLDWHEPWTTVTESDLANGTARYRLGGR
jgi:acetyl-CoA synthetase